MITISAENVLQCSESMVSSTPSDDSQGNSQLVSTDGTNVNKADTTGVCDPELRTAFCFFKQRPNWDQQKCASYRVCHILTEM